MIVPARDRPRRAGFTLIEVMIAMMITAVVTLGMGAFMVQFIGAVSTANVRATANELVADRLEQVKGATRYSAIDSIYAGTEAAIPGFSGFERTTLVNRVGGLPPDLYDYRVVTVIVSGRNLPQPVKKTTVISSF